jgi:gamma-glutamylcyclotransferase (GGCT)/AIG2-like uncharacterized protein YtfP
MRFFIYGTLMSPEVMQIVINRVPHMTPGLLQGSFKCIMYFHSPPFQGFQRHPVKERAYPAIIPNASSCVEGHILTVDPLKKEEVLLDLFEDEVSPSKKKTCPSYQKVDLVD